MRASWPSLIIWSALIALGVLNVWFPIIERGFNAIFMGYFKFVVWMFIAVAPSWLAFLLARFVIARSDIRLQFAVLSLWAIPLGLAIILISSDDLRKRLFERLHRVGTFTPLAYACGVLLLALPFYGAVTRVLMNKGMIALEGNPENVFDFYLWHFLDAVPLLRINETLLWNEPMSYTANAVGWLLLAFKITVIVPVIAAFAGYWKFAREKRAQRVAYAARERDEA